MLKKTLPAPMVLSFADRKRLADFFIILIEVNNRVKKEKSKARKAKKTKAKPRDRLAKRESFFAYFFLINPVSLSNYKIFFTKFISLKTCYMIDTVVLTLSKDTFDISDPDKFLPSARWALKENSGYVLGLQSKQNPTRKELLKGIYKPRLTLFNRVNLAGKPEMFLKVELSLPKLLFGNNFNELQLKDFKLVLNKLVLVLETMGIKTSQENISKAPISAIHYSKNIQLNDGSIPYHFINKIKEANIKLSLDVNQTDYRNDGHSYRWHCNSYEVVFYDKIKDLEKAKQSSKRSLEKDSALQLSLFDAFKKRNKLEILRMEVRLNKRQKIKQLLKTLNIKSDLSLKSLFKPAISKKILLHYIDELESKRSVLLDYKPSNDKSLLTTLIINNPELSPKQILQMFGLKKALESFNARELRAIFSKQSQRSWSRLMTDANKIKLSIPSTPLSILREYLLNSRILKISSN